MIMPYDYQHAKAGEFQSSGGTDHAEGFVVFDTRTQVEVATFTTEEEAQSSCEKLNQKEQDA